MDVYARPIRFCGGIRKEPDLELLFLFHEPWLSYLVKTSKPMNQLSGLIFEVWFELFVPTIYVFVNLAEVQLYLGEERTQKTQRVKDVSKKSRRQCDEYTLMARTDLRCRRCRRS